MEKHYCKICFNKIKNSKEEQIKTGKLICNSCEQSGKKLISCRSCKDYFAELSEWGFCQQCDGRR